MESPEELRKWVGSLNMAEKRFITVLGKARAGAKYSQQLELFEWLNRAEPGENFPAGARFMQNLPTVSRRLKDLILDGVRLLHKENGNEALLRTTLDEIAILVEKKLYPTALRQLRRAKKLALATSRYSYALQCIGYEQRLTSVSSPGNEMDMLNRLRLEEKQILQQQDELSELQFRHQQLLLIVKQYPYHRSPDLLEKVAALAGEEYLLRYTEAGNYVERAIAVNLQGIRDLYERRPGAALQRYQQLLEEWKQKPEWQTDQVELLLLLCKFYQSACFYNPVDWSEAKNYILMADAFKGLSADAGRDFQRILFHTQFSLALNTGNFDSVQTLIPEIDAWMDRQGDQLTAAQVLAFLCNFSVACFLNEDFATANRFVTRINNLPDRNARKDIRAFGQLLKAVLQFELDNEGLNEYLTRAGKRHFSKSSFEIGFELTVFRMLDELLRAGSDKARQNCLIKFRDELQKVRNEQPEGIPLLGLNEISMWVESKNTGQSLRAVFLDAVRKNLEELERAAQAKP